MIDEDVRTFLQTLPGLNNQPIEEGTIDIETGYTRLWYGRSGEELPKTITCPGIIRTNFDVECISDNISTAQTFADAIKGLHGFSGTVGATRALAVWVTDQKDNYVPKNEWATLAGLHVAALSLQIVY